jgi:5-methylcytosine-specific restriction endonuclease McrA
MDDALLKRMRRRTETLVSENKGKGRSLLLLLLALLLFPLPLGAAQKVGCVSCHEGQVFREGAHGKKESVPFTGKDLKDSVHREIGCNECHRDVSTLPHKKGLAKVNCGTCHKETAALFERSVHGLAYKRGDKDAPSCISCHGTHRIYRVSDQRSPVYRTNMILLCARCHTDVEVQKTHKLPSSDLIKAYENSVHGRLLKEGKLVRAAVCTDCHGAHLILGPKEPESKTNKANMPQVCGRCHVQIYNEYKLSIHGQALKQGKLESPGCTDCHGEHTLKVVKDPQAGVYVRNVSSTCARCHENQEIIKKYRLPSDRYSSYLGSFHSVAMKYGNITAANCTSCHEIHRILPATDAASSINPQNLSRTCGKCHPAMKEAVSIGKIHVEARKESSLGMYYVRRFYTWFIGILMALFVGYIALDVYGRIRRKRHGE